MFDSKLKSIINSVQDLPPMPLVATKVLKMMGDPDYEVEDLAATIAHDPAVAARILKIANSSFYNLQRQVNSLDQAIFILGEKTLKSLILASCLKGMNRAFGLVEKMLWEDSIGCAVGARMIAVRFRCADPEEAFLAGLLHHIGKTVMNNMDHERFLQMVEEVYNCDGALTQIEQSFFPFTHAEVGAAVLYKWKFSEVMARLVLYHGDPRFLGGELTIPDEDAVALLPLLATVNLARNFCRKAGIGQRFAEENLLLIRSQGAQLLGLEPDPLNQLYEDFQECFLRDRGIFLD